MFLPLVLVLCISFALATPLAPATVGAVIETPSVLSQTRSSLSSCVVGKFLVLAGGLDSAGTSLYNTVDVIDLTTSTRADIGSLASARYRMASAPWGTTGCLFIGGSDLTNPLNNTELVTINPSTGAIVSITAVADYPTTTDVSTCLEGSGSVWCFGGNFAAKFDGTAWTTLPDIPAQAQFLVAAPSKITGTYGSCVLWGTTVWCCGSTPMTNVCQLFDTTTSLWSNYTLPAPRSQCGVVLLSYPKQRLVLWGGSNATGYHTESLVIESNGSGGYVTTSTVFSPGLLGPSASIAVGTTAFAIGADNAPADATSALVYTINADSTSVTTGSSFDLPYTSYYWADGDLTPVLTATGAGSYSNRVVFCGGVDVGTSATFSSCWTVSLYCLGNATYGRDLWTDNAPTWVGCDLGECYHGYYGPNCTACDCSGQACSDGFYGTGTCICSPNYYGSNCGSLANCTSNGAPVDGSSGSGVCICKPGFTGTYCENIAQCSNGGVFDQANSTCICPKGYYGATCDNQCMCAVGAGCDDGATGSGECFCVSGTYTLPGAVRNCTGTCICGQGVCNDGNYGDGSCQCYRGFFGSDCSQDCMLPNSVERDGCNPVVLSPTEIITFRCDDGVTGTGQCIRLYSSASSMMMSLLLVISALFMSF